MAKKKVTLEFIAEQIAELSADVADVKGTMATKSDIANLERDIKEINERFDPLSHAHDTDAVTIVRHEKRITRLEKHAGIAA